MIQLIIVLCVVGFLLWLVLTYVPMPAPFKQVIIAIVVLALVLYVLQAFGIIGGSLPRLR